MNMLTSNYYDDLRAKLELIQAVLDGKVIEFCEQFENVWSVLDEPDFSCALHRYRIKPPLVELWVVVDVANNVLWSGLEEDLAKQCSKVCNEVNRVVKLTEVT